MRHHKRLHTQLHKVALSLVESGVIQYNKQTETYFLPHLEEILDEYRVNSEKTYVLRIDNSGNMAILSQAELENNSEGATTILLRSSDQEIAKRTTS